LIVIDDSSTDDTQAYIEGVTDPRVCYIRNSRNISVIRDDRAHLRKFVKEYARGEYFVYLCDDDFGVPKDLVRRQVSAMRAHPSPAMVIGG